MSKRANGEGSVRQRPNGRWEGRIQYNDPITGETVRKSVYGKTAKETRDKLREIRRRVDDGQPGTDAAVTLASWMERWRSTTLAVSDRKQTTKNLYANMSERHIEAGAIGARRLDRLRPSDIEAMILAMQRATKENKEGDVVRVWADSTIRTTYTILRQALDAAVRDGLLARNPAAAVRRPGVEKKEARFLDTADLRRLLNETDASRHGRALRLIALTGMRRGEALALRWDDLDLEAAVAVVRGTLARLDGNLTVTATKTERSRRAVPLSPAAVAVITEQRKAQVADRLRAGSVWSDTGYVFTTEAGAPVDPRNLLRVVKVAVTRLGLPTGVGVHTLRHSAAVAMLEGGVNIRAVADLLGHSSIAITGDVYGHTTDAAARAAVSVLDVAAGSA